MKKGIVILTSLFFILTVVANAIGEEQKLKKGDRMVLLKIDKGEMCTANESDVEVSLSKEKAAKGKMYSIKYSIKKGNKGGLFIITNDSGLLRGKRGNWEGYDTLNIEYFCTAKSAISAYLNIGDEKAYNPWDGKKQAVRKVVILPGQNTLSVDITNLERTYAGEGVQDLKNMRGFFLSVPTNEDWDLYIQDVYLEKE